jgi:hypothetical protein
MDKKKLFSKLKNPKGPFTMDFVFSGIEFNAVINHAMPSEYTIKLKSKTKNISKYFLDNVKGYLELEGFVDMAEKHNLFW